MSGGIIKGLKNRALESCEGLCYNLKRNPDDEVNRLNSGVNTQVLSPSRRDPLPVRYENKIPELTLNAGFEIFIYAHILSAIH